MVSLAKNTIISTFDTINLLVDSNFAVHGQRLNPPGALWRRLYLKVTKDSIIVWTPWQAVAVCSHLSFTYMNEFRKDILDTQNSLFGPFNDFKAGSDSAYYKIVPCSSSKPM